MFRAKFQLYGWVTILNFYEERRIKLGSWRWLVEKFMIDTRYASVLLIATLLCIKTCIYFPLGWCLQSYSYIFTCIESLFVSSIHPSTRSRIVQWFLSGILQLSCCSCTSGRRCRVVCPGRTGVTSHCYPDTRSRELSPDERLIIARETLLWFYYVNPTNLGYVIFVLVSLFKTFYVYLFVKLI